MSYKWVYINSQTGYNKPHVERLEWNLPSECKLSKDNNFAACKREVETDDVAVVLPVFTAFPSEVQNKSPLDNVDWENNKFKELHVFVLGWDLR